MTVPWGQVGSAGSVGHGGEELDGHHAGNDQADADDRREVRALAVDHQPHQGDQHDAQPRPDGVGDADWYGAQYQRQHIEGHGIAHHHNQGGARTGKALRCLEGTGCHHLGDDRQSQIEEGHHGSPPTTVPGTSSGAWGSVTTSLQSAWPLAWYFCSKGVRKSPAGAWGSISAGRPVAWVVARANSST